MEEDENLKVMGIFEHIEELRSRLVKSLMVLMVFFAACYFFADDILNFLKQPLVEVLPKGKPALYFTGPMDVFMANMKLGFFTALVLSCPIWLYQLWKFLEPALYEREKRYVVPFMVSSISLFIAGVALCFYFILPMALKYLIGLGEKTDTAAIITISDYLSLVMLMLAGFGAVFETPVILVMLSLLGLITAQDLKNNRKYVVIGIFVIAAVLTPTPDPISQCAMAAPTWLLFELSIVIISVLEKKKLREEAAEQLKKNHKE